ncbi:MAG: glutathione synthase, partial [Rhodospirillaceae bacterium]|nr:glutathione synthase [Rhodospirillaceae bacterium]
MTLAVAIQMDPMDRIDINGDSTFVLALEAQKRGFGLFHYLPNRLSFRDGRVFAKANPMEVRREAGNYFSFGETQEIDLSLMDVILMRQDPP